MPVCTTCPRVSFLVPLLCLSLPFSVFVCVRVVSVGIVHYSILYAIGSCMIAIPQFMTREDSARFPPSTRLQYTSNTYTVEYTAEYSQSPLSSCVPARRSVVAMCMCVCVLCACLPVPSRFSTLASPVSLPPLLRRGVYLKYVCVVSVLSLLSVGLVCLGMVSVGILHYMRHITLSEVGFTNASCDLERYAIFRIQIQEREKWMVGLIVD